MEAIPTDNTA